MSQAAEVIVPKQGRATSTPILTQLVLAVLSFVMGIWLYQALFPWLDTPDGWIHLHRTQALTEALRQGVWLPRWLPDFSFGYGYPVFHFYASASYYPPALLGLVGIDLLTATRLSLATTYALSGLMMGLALHKFNSFPAALVGTLTYLLFPYRLYDLFVRGAFPEFFAFLWLPCLIYLYLDLYERLDPPSLVAPNYIALTCCWAALITTHNLSALMVAMVLVALLPFLHFFATRTFTSSAQTHSWHFDLWQTSHRLLLPLLLGSLLSAWYWLPAILEARWVGIGANDNGAGYLHHFANWQNLFAWRATYLYPNAAEPTVPLPGWLLFVMVIATAIAIVCWRRDKMARVLLVLLLLLGVVLWLTTNSSAPLWAFSSAILGKLQFPWRWQTLLAALSSLLVATLWTTFANLFQPSQPYTVCTNNHENVASGKGQVAGIIRNSPLATRYFQSGVSLLLVLISSIYLFFYSTNGLTSIARFATPPVFSVASMWATDATFGQVGASWTAEFLPKWVTEQRWAIGRAPSDGSSSASKTAIHARVMLQQSHYAAASYRIETPETTTFYVHQFYYPAWQVWVDGKRVDSFPSGNLGLLAFEVEQGEHEVSVRFGATTAIWLGRLLGGVGWIALLLLLARRPVRGNWRLFVWLLVGVIMLVAANGKGSASALTQPELDFGAVQLTGVEIKNAQAGGTASVRLHWLIKAANEPLVAFVHLVAADGKIVAQHDGALAGDYTPVERWQPGLLLDNRHDLSLPADLAIGDYQVLVGLYPAGKAKSPLLAAGKHEPRTQVGTLRVVP